ncbi:MAG: O-antigen ligase family protein, partial [Gemmatimonadaceae bacterium]|nr:O-antigen ligase family protein [Gemmatimonadaceae bacterium]
MDSSLRAPSAAERVASVVLVAGAIAIVLAALPYKPFDLDRFFVPKELVLALTTASIAVALIETSRRLDVARIDLLLLAWLALNTVSALFATNGWLAGRALGVTAGGVATFWCARAIACTGAGRWAIPGLAFAAVVASATSLAQAYGWSSEYISVNRAPGGTLGNRNFVAHLAAIGVPALLYLTLGARRWFGSIIPALGLAVSAAALVMSRTRAAWLALIVAGVVLLTAAIWRRRIIFTSGVLARVLIAAVFVAGAATAAMLLPNQLRWKSDSPYLETATDVVNYRDGSGRGRLIQYRNTAKLALDNPLLGVGPGNWSVAYPAVASRRDPSLDGDGMTANPWPSSDWVAFLSERGIPAFAALALAFLLIALGALRRVARATTTAGGMRALALAGTVLVTALVGAFDAVLLLGPPSLIAWALIGALMAPVTSRWRFTPSESVRRVTLVLALALAALFIIRALSQALAMAVYAESPGRAATIMRAARIDP